MRRVFSTTEAAFQDYVHADMASTIAAANLTAWVSPACPTLTNGKCASRPAASTLRIHMSYDASASIFLPTRTFTRSTSWRCSERR